jgi:asparagine synthase (glutamine-hydrolysing)
MQQEALLGDVLRNCNGQYAIAVQNRNALWLACDHMRSLPLYYVPDSGQGSDCFDLLADSQELDKDSLVEFALAGFVSGHHTLHPRVRTVQAGEVVRIADGNAHAFRWYPYHCSYEQDSEGEEILDRLDQVLLDSCARAIETCQGRQVAVPLSGGLDSRALLCAFKRLGYDNLVAFAYGLPDNHEMVRSREVAEALHVPWFPVHYDPRKLSGLMSGKSLFDFLKYSAQGSAMPCLTEWPAIKHICEQGLVQPGAVFLSGQSGDFINGSHLKYLLDPEWNQDPLDVWTAILSKHYSLWLDVAARPGCRAAVYRRLSQVLGEAPFASQEAACRAYEFWECQERQLKYVVQGGRVFDFFGHDWVMPLWDKAFMDFFKGISIGLKMRGYLYAKTLATHDPFGVFQDDLPRRRFDRDQALQSVRRKEGRPGRRIRKAASHLPFLKSFLWRRQRQRIFRHQWRYDPLGFSRSYPESSFINSDPGKKHCLSLWIRDYLQGAYGVDLQTLS